MLLQGFDPGANGDDEPAASQAGKKSSKNKESSKGRVQTVTNAFSALGLEEEQTGQEDTSDDDPAEDTSEQRLENGMANGTAEADEQGKNSIDAAQQDGEQGQVAAVAPSRRKEKKGKLDIGGAFSALGLEDNGSADSGDTIGTEAHSRANGHAEPSDAQAPQEAELSISNTNGELFIVWVQEP